MTVTKILQRFLVPRALISLHYLLRFGCRVSPRAEVELSPNLKLGRKTQVSSFCKIKATDGPVEIGANVSIGTGSFISSHNKGVFVGDNCLIGPNVTVVAGNYRYDRIDIPMREQGYISKGIRIGTDAFIGAGAVVLDGSEIGHGVIVTPNSVVSGRIKENSIVQGNPAKAIFERR